MADNRNTRRHALLIENPVTHVLPHELALQRALGLPPISTGTYPVRDPVAHFRALRMKQMGLARLCATDKARREYVSYAWAASWQVKAQKAHRRAQEAKFGVMAEGCLLRRQA